MNLERLGDTFRDAILIVKDFRQLDVERLCPQRGALVRAGYPNELRCHADAMGSSLERALDYAIDIERSPNGDRITCS